MSLSFCVRFSADAEQLVEKAALLRQAACGQGLWLHSPRTAAFGDRFALHMPRHWPCGGVCALRAALSARLSAMGAHRSHTRLRVRSPTPFWRHSPRGLHFTAQRCKALPPPSFPRTLLLLLYLFQQSVPQMRISIGFLSPSKISEHNKIRFFNWQSAAFYFIVLQQFTSLCLTGDHQNTAIVPLVVAGA